MTHFPENTKVQILVSGEWQGPYTVTARQGRTPEHLVLSGPHGMFEHYFDGPFNTREIADPAGALAELEAEDRRAKRQAELEAESAEIAALSAERQAELEPERPTIKCAGRNGSYVCQYVSDEPHKGMHFCVYMSHGERRRAEWVDAWSQVHYRKAN